MVAAGNAQGDLRVEMHGRLETGLRRCCPGFCHWSRSPRDVPNPIHPFARHLIGKGGTLRQGLMKS